MSLLIRFASSILTSDALEAAAEGDVETLLAGGKEAGPGAYFAEHVRRNLEENYGAAAIYREGLKVYTTLDLDLQIAAEKAVEEHLRRLEGAFDYVPRDTMGAETTPEDVVQTDYRDPVMAFHLISKLQIFNNLRIPILLHINIGLVFVEYSPDVHGRQPDSDKGLQSLGNCDRAGNPRQYHRLSH